jgi:hypothetical protein
MSIEELIKEIQDNIEWLETMDMLFEVECISVENLEVILGRFLNREIKLTLE